MPVNDKPTTVLLADDEFYVRSVVAGMLRNAGLTIIAEAGDGEEALELFHQHHPDLLLLDVNMPHQTGIEVLQAVMAECPSAKVIMLTSLADEETVEQCLALGAAGYIRKDCKPDDMCAMIRDVMATGKGG